MRKTLTALLCVCLLSSAAALGGSSRREPVSAALENCPILHETEFGGVYIKAAIAEFNALGYQYGDSVDVVFSNGYRLEDQPYYNGYYTDYGQSLLVAYPGYDYIKACINCGSDLWELAALSESETATVTLRERGKYLSTQKARDIHYTDDRSDYASDVVFANFRSVSAAGVAPGMLYRSASPCDNQHKRAPYVDALIQSAGVRCILNLADSEEKIESYLSSDAFASPFFLDLYKNGHVLPLALSADFSSAEFQQKLTAGLRAMAEQEGPYLIHCTEGKDRTGFVCLLLEALCGASCGDIVDDYMLTYDNYYGINRTSDPERYAIIVSQVLDPMVRFLAGSEDTDLEKADLAAGARSFLLSGGMEEQQIDALRERLTAP